MHDFPEECMDYLMKNKLDITRDNYDRLPTTNQLTHALMKLALRTKCCNVPLVIELYDAINFKLLMLDITDSDTLMAGIHNSNLNIFMPSADTSSISLRSLLLSVVSFNLLSSSVT